MELVPWAICPCAAGGRRRTASQPTLGEPVTTDVARELPVPRGSEYQREIACCGCPETQSRRARTCGLCHSPPQQHSYAVSIPCGRHLCGAHTPHAFHPVHAVAGGACEIDVVDGLMCTEIELGPMRRWVAGEARLRSAPTGSPPPQTQQGRGGRLSHTCDSSARASGQRVSHARKCCARACGGRLFPSPQHWHAQRTPPRRVLILPMPSIQVLAAAGVAREMRGRCCRQALMCSDQPQRGIRGLVEAQLGAERVRGNGHSPCEV